MDRHFRLEQLVASVLSKAMTPPSAEWLLESILGEGDAFFVQVGANDGEQNDPLIEIIRRNVQLRGLLIEPIPYYYDKLISLHRRNLHRLNICQAAISDERKRFSFHYIDPAVADEMNGEGPPNNWAHGQGSTNRDIVLYWIEQNAFRGETYRANIPRFVASIIETELDFIPLSDLTRSEHFPPIDALVIDVQGHELEVLRSANLSARRPGFIYYEDDLGTNREIDDFLTANGYRYLFGDGNKIYFDLSAFSRPEIRMADAAPVRRSDRAEIAKVVSTCILRDIEVWKVAAPRILSCIYAEAYEVVVPDSEVEMFRQNTPDQYRIIPESRYAHGFDLARIRESLPDERKDRAGWYLQQLLKIESCRSDSQDEDIVLIWDADTVPAGPLQFVTPEGRLIFRTSGEYHEPYFACIERLIGLPRSVSHSFIAQCFPLRGRWVKSLASAIEARHGIHYFEAILQCAEKASISGFSEYETLGTFAFHHFNGEMVFSAAPWLRGGKSVFGNLQTFASVMALEYVTFEHGE